MVILIEKGKLNGSVLFYLSTTALLMRRFVEIRDQIEFEISDQKPKYQCKNILGKSV